MDTTLNDTEPKDKKERTKYEVYLEERKLLVQAKKEGSQQFDRAILTLAAGALAISITFINQIAPHPKPWTIYFLVLGWIAFIMSLLFTLISFLTSQKACTEQIAILEHSYFEAEGEPNKKNNPGIWTSRLNIASIGTFVIGVVLLASFSISNIAAPNEEVVMPNKENKKNEEKGFEPPQTPQKPPDPKPGDGYVPDRPPVQPPTQPPKK